MMLRRRLSFTARSLALGACLLVAQGACGEDRAATAGLDCVNIDGCPADQVCFFGKCVEPGYNISSVWVDATPPHDSGLQAQVDRDSPRDLSEGSQQDISLRASVPIAGTVKTPGGESRDGIIIATPGAWATAVTLPSTLLTQRSNVVGGEFSMRLVPGDYTVKFLPDDPARPPVDSWFTEDHPLQATASTTAIRLTYPDDSSLVRVHGTVFAARNSVPTEDARVEGVANADSSAPMTCTTDITDAEGYELVCPPGAQAFTVTVRPDPNPLVPVATKTLPLLEAPTADAPGILEPFVLEIGAAFSTVNAIVRSVTGQPVGDAALAFDGEVGAGLFTANTSSAAAGGEAAVGTVNVQLLPGEYTVTMAPLKSQQYALTTTHICVGEQFTADTCDGVIAGVSPIELTVGEKVKLTGFASSFGGAPLADALITFSTRDTRLPREFSVTTHSDGGYAVYLDPGTFKESLRYELLIDPLQGGDRPLPRHRQIVDISDSPEHEQDIRLYDASLVFGRVQGPTGSVVGRSTVAFFSAVLGTNDTPLLVGLGQSNENGEFVIPIPIPDPQ